WPRRRSRTHRRGRRRSPGRRGRSRSVFGVAGDLILSVLDQSPVPEGLESRDPLRNTPHPAAWGGCAGYPRYWVAEHHGGPMLAGASPEVLVAAIAGATNHIR